MEKEFKILNKYTNSVFGLVIKKVENKKIIPQIVLNNKIQPEDILYDIYNKSKNKKELSKKLQEYGFHITEIESIIYTLYFIKQFNKEPVNNIDKILKKEIKEYNVQPLLVKKGYSKDKIPYLKNIKNFIKDKNNIKVMLGASQNGKDYIFNSIEMYLKKIENKNLNKNLNKNIEII